MRTLLLGMLLCATLGLFCSGLPARASAYAALPPLSPLAATVTAPGSGATVSGTMTLAATVSGQAAKLVFRITAGNGTVTSVPGAVDPNDATSYGGTWDSTGVADGSYSITATVTGTDGSTATSSAVTFMVANATQTSFAVTVTAPGAGSTQHGIVSLAAQTTAAATGLTFTFASVPSGAQVPSITAISDTQALLWQASWDSTAFPSGAYTLVATATSSVGSARSASVSFTVDNPPTITVTAPAEGATVSASTTVSAKTTSSVDGMAFQLVAGDGSVATTVTGSDAGGGTSWNGTLDPTGVPDGSYQIFAVASVSGTSVKSLPVDVTVSTTSSSTATSQPPVTSSSATVAMVTPSPSATVSGTVTMSATTTGTVSGVKFTVNVQPSTPAFSPVVLQASSADGVTWTASWDSTTADDGTYTVMAGADANGTNVMSDQTSFTVSNGSSATTTTSSTPLAVTVTAPTGGDIAGGAELTATSMPDAASMQFMVTNTDTGGQLPPLSASFDSSRSVWTATFPPDPMPGNYQIKAVAADGGGNTYGSMPVSVTVASTTTTSTTSTPPVVSVTAPGAQSTVNGMVVLRASVTGTVSSLRFDLVSSSDASKTFTADATLGSDGSWAGTWDSTAAPNDAYLITAVATLADGTEVKSVQLPFAVQNTAPAPNPTPLTAAAVEAPAAGDQVSGQVALIASTQGDAERVHFTVVRSGGTGTPDAVDAVLDTSKGLWRATWDTTPLTVGDYSIVAVASAGTTTVMSDPVVATVVSPASPSVTPRCTVDADCGDGQVCTDGACMQAPVPGPAPVTTPTPAPAVTSSSSATGGSKAVSVTSPKQGEVQGIVMLVASASDLGDVSFTVGTPSSSTPPFSTPAELDAKKNEWVSYWDASAATPGDYVIVAGGTTSSGTRIVSDPVDVTVVPATTNAGSVAAAPPEVPQAVVRDVVFRVPSGKKTLQRPELSKAVLQPDMTLQGECDKAGIPSSGCAAWLVRNDVDPACRAAGIITKEECIAYLRDAGGGTMQGCGTAPSAACDKIMAEKTAGLMAAVELDAVQKDITPMIGTTVHFQRTGTPGQTQGSVPASVADLVPIEAAASEVSLHVQASSAYSAVDASTLRRAVPAVLFVDSDGDGLPDDTERRLGTDPHKADTDGDGVSDLQEIRNGTNPLGPGPLPADMVLSPVDRAVVAGVPIAQPSAAATASPDLAVQAADVGPSGTGITAAPPSAVAFSGRGTPGDVVSLYVYSYLPVVLTTKVDNNGDWTYDLQDALVGGEHQVYVTVTDDTGKITKQSDPLSFVVPAAGAVTTADAAAIAQGGHAAAPVPATFASAGADTAGMFRWYLIGVAALLVIGMGLGIAIVLRGRKR